jgi:hypothetical protein
MVTICGETYDILSKRFEHTAENLPSIGAFYNNFKTAVLSLTKSNIMMPPPDNYVYGASAQDKMMQHRMNGTPYPWHLGYDQNGYPYGNPPPPTPEDRKQYGFLQKNMEKQKHEDHKVLEMLWSWIGDFRRHTLSHIYRDHLLSTREKINQMIALHRSCIGQHGTAIIGRYKLQWHSEKTPACYDVTTAVRNLHILQNINNSISDLDSTQTFTTEEILLLIIPTLMHDNFRAIIKHWNDMIATKTYVPTSSLQPSLEECFVAKDSINNQEWYSHVGFTANRPDKPIITSSSSFPPTISPSKKGYAYAASSQEPALPTTAAQLNQMIAAAIRAHDQNQRSRSPSSPSQPRNNYPTRDRSRDRTPERKDNDRRGEHRSRESRDKDRNVRREHQGRPQTQRPSRETNQRGDRSQSSERTEPIKQRA